MRGPWPKEVNFWEKIWNELARKKSFCSKTCFRFSRKGEDLLKVHETKPSSSDDSITPYNGTLTFFLYIVKQIYCCSCISEGKSILSYIHKGIASKDRDVIILNCYHLSDCTWSVASSSGPHNTEDRLKTVQRKARKVIKGLESPPCEERLKEFGPFTLEKAQRRPHHSFPLLAERLQRGWSLCLHKQPHWENKGQWVQVSLGELLAWYKKKAFDRENHWDSLPKDLVAAPSLQVFKMQLDRVPYNFIRSLFSRKGWTRWPFKIPSNLSWCMIL